MNETKERLKKIAVEKHGKIFPVGRHTNIDDCFTYYGDKILFWFNDQDASTKMIIGTVEN